MAKVIQFPSPLEVPSARERAEDSLPALPRLVVLAREVALPGRQGPHPRNGLAIARWIPASQERRLPRPFNAI
jgi:hypothetical protein